MKVLAWNCKELGSLSAVRALKEAIRSSNPLVVGLVETKSDNRRCEAVKVKLDFDCCFVVPARGRSGDKFPNATIQHLVSHYLNHCTLLLNLDGVIISQEKLFIFESVWMRDASIVDTVNKNWSSNGNSGNISEKLAQLSQHLKIWNKKNFGNVGSHLRRLKEELVEVRQEAHNRVLMEPYSECEIKTALIQLYSYKAPSLDGFRAGFFQKFWSTIRSDFTAPCFSILNERIIPTGTNETLIVLIPKQKSATRMEEYRPVSLTSVVSKTVAKVIVNRLQRILPEVISPAQSAFIKDRLITDNYLIAHEAAHFIKNARHGRSVYGSLKLDMSKAYDELNEDI
ncbi:hypothetical protein QQ045_030700 [Rhodiola kirilowii]